MKYLIILQNINQNFNLRFQKDFSSIALRKSHFKNSFVKNSIEKTVKDGANRIKFSTGF